MWIIYHNFKKENQPSRTQKKIRSSEIFAILLNYLQKINPDKVMYTSKQISSKWAMGGKVAHALFLIFIVKKFFHRLI